MEHLLLFEQFILEEKIIKPLKFKKEFVKKLLELMKICIKYIYILEHLSKLFL